MSGRFAFPTPTEPPGARSLRAEVRAFLAERLGHRTAAERAASWSGFDAEFSREVGARGWIGMTWPSKYGGGARSVLERYVVLEEMLAAGAPVGAHWITDRQAGPLILAFGSERHRTELLPAICRGECFIAVGMSESEAGSDLAALRTRATPVDGGFRLSGAKLWTTNAHQSHYLIVLCRTDEPTGDRHRGLSQILVPTDAAGLTIRPIMDMTGEHQFNEVVFDDVFAPDSAVIGRRGDGWSQVMLELAHERSGPERFLSSFCVLDLLAAAVARAPTDEGMRLVGRLVARLAVLRRMSLSVTELMARGEDASVQAAIVKDLGSLFEQDVPEAARQVIALEPRANSPDLLASALAATLVMSPAFSLRGGAREILRGIIARRLLR